MLHVRHAAAAINEGLCNTVLITHGESGKSGIGRGGFGGGASTVNGQFESPYGIAGPPSMFTIPVLRYMKDFGLTHEELAMVAVVQREWAGKNPRATMKDPITVEDVLASRMVAEPLRVLEIVMPAAGGGALVVTRDDIARRCRHRAVRVIGCGEHLHSKSPTYAPDMLATPIGPASRKAFAMAGVAPADVDMAQIYDCYTITVLLTLEDAGFCAKGEGLRFLREHDFTFKGDFPMNTHGGQLSFGQSGTAGGMSQVIEAMHQIQGRAGARQLARHDLAYVSGTGGVMSEQGALVLRGA